MEITAVLQAHIKTFDPQKDLEISNTSDTSSLSITNGLNELLSQVSEQITSDELDLPAHFNFIWNAIPFAGQLFTYKNKNTVSISLAGDIGYIPYSAEDFVLRQKMLISLASYTRKGELHISHGNRIQVILQTDFSGTLSAKKILQVITFTLLDIKQKLAEIANEFPPQH